jgi:hypothetical protein
VNQRSGLPSCGLCASCEFEEASRGEKLQVDESESSALDQKCAYTRRYAWKISRSEYYGRGVGRRSVSSEAAMKHPWARRSMLAIMERCLGLPEEHDIHRNNTPRVSGIIIPSAN